MKRTTMFLTTSQLKDLAEASKTDGIGLAPRIRIFVTEGLTRRKRAAKKLAALDAPVAPMRRARQKS